jgi:hypothetical protein
MDTFPIPTCNRILLVVASSADSGLLLELTARLALHSAPFVIDGGNTFQGYQLASLLKRRSPDYEAALERTQLSRVFTCYQMFALLSQTGLDSSPPVSQPVINHPVVIMDFLASFYDQSVAVADRSRLLSGCIAHLRRLSRQVPLAVWVCRRDLVPPEGPSFLARLEAAAGQSWAPGPPARSGWKQAALPDG